jgi:benzil reductase ((S)-benzoin forming)
MIIITGGGSGIGKALALALAKKEKEILIVGRRETILQKTAALSPHIHILCADVSTDEGRKQVLAKVKDKEIQALVNNAGTLEPVLPLNQVTLSQWQKIMAIHVEAPLFLTQLLQKSLQKGRVLNIGSGLAHIPSIGLGAYCTSKAALSMLTLCLQLENKDIAIANVMPGIVDTHMQTILRSTSNVREDTSLFYQTLQESHRLVSAETVAAFLVWLLLEVPQQQFIAQEWDIYDRSHHAQWLQSPKDLPSINL